MRFVCEMSRAEGCLECCCRCDIPLLECTFWMKNGINWEQEENQWSTRWEMSDRYSSRRTKKRGSLSMRGWKSDRLVWGRCLYWLRYRTIESEKERRREKSERKHCLFVVYLEKKRENKIDLPFADSFVDLADWRSIPASFQDKNLKQKIKRSSIKRRQICGK